MHKKRNFLSGFSNIFLLLSIVIPIIIALSSHMLQWASALCLFLFGIYLGCRIGIAKIVGQIEGADMVLRNLPKDGEVIDLSLYYKGFLIIEGPSPFKVQYPEKSSEKFEQNYGPFNLDLNRKLSFSRIITKPPKEDFEDIYNQAKNENITSRRAAFKLWREKYPDRVKELSDPWGSFKKGMKTQEKLHRKIFD
jgi:hypothetical protein